MKYVDEEKILGLIFEDTKKSAKESFDNDFVVEQRGDLLYFDDQVIGLSKKAENTDSVTIDGASIGSLNDLPEDIYSIYSSKVYPNLKSVNLGNVAVMESNFLKLCCPNLEAVANIDYHNYEEQELFYYGALAELPKLQFLRINSDNIYEGAFNNNRLLEQVELGHSVDTIPVRAFENCSALTDVVFTSDLSSIEKNAFAGCVSLRQLSTEDDFTREDWNNLDIDPAAFIGVPRDCMVVLSDGEFPLFDEGSSGSIATEEAEGNIDEANRLKAEANRLENLEDNSGGRVDYSDEINELEGRAAKEEIASKKFTHRFTDEEIKELERKDESIGYVNCREARFSSYGDPCSDESYYVGKDGDKYYLASVYGYADGDTSDGIYKEFSTIDELNDAIAKLELDEITYKGDGSAKESCTRKRAAKESKCDQAAIASLKKELNKLGYENRSGDDDLHVFKPIEGVDVFISLRDKNGKVHDDFAVFTYPGAADRYIEKDADIDALAAKLKKALAKGKADLEKVKSIVGSAVYKSAHASLRTSCSKSAEEGLSSEQRDAITDEAVKLYERYLKEHNIKECDVTGEEFRKILYYIMKHSSLEISVAQYLPDYYGGYNKEAAREAFAKSRRSFKK